MTIKQAPGPKGLSAVKSVLAMGQKDPLTYWRDAHQIYGDTIKFNMWPVDIWFFASPTSIYDVLVTQNRVMRKGIGYSGLRKLLGEGLITTDRNQWLSQRQRLNPLFTPAAVNAYANSVYEATRAGLDEIREQAERDGVIDAGHSMTRLTMRIISLAAFGVDLTSGHDEIVEAFEFAFAFVADITVQPLRPPLFVPIPSNRKFNRALAIIDGFIDQLIDQSMSTSGQQAMNREIFAALAGIDRKLLRDEVLSLYFAGFETTARSMTFLMHLLPDHPEILAELRKEAQRLEAAVAREAPLAGLPLVTEVVNETLRLYPPVAMMARQPNNDCLIDGYEVRANSMVIVCPFLAQRNEQYWASGAEFAPSLSKPLARRLKHRGAFAPFGAGPRMCLGKNFAMVEMVIATALLVREFNWELCENDPLALDFHGTLRPKGIIRAKISANQAA